MKSRVHPTYKTRYRVGNWRVYERALVRRGDVTLWLSPDATAAWRALSSGRPGGQLRFSDVDEWEARRGCQLVRPRDNTYRLKMIKGFVMPGTSPPLTFGDKAVAQITT